MTVGDGLDGGVIDEVHCRPAALTPLRALISPVVKDIRPATPAFAAPICARYIASALTSFPRNSGSWLSGRRMGQ